MKIIIEIGNDSARSIGKFLFILGGFFILMALLAAVTTTLIFPSLILTVIGGMLSLSGIYLMVKVK